MPQSPSEQTHTVVLMRNAGKTLALLLGMTNIEGPYLRLWQPLWSDMDMLLTTYCFTVAVIRNKSRKIRTIELYNLDQLHTDFSIWATSLKFHNWQSNGFKTAWKCITTHTADALSIIWQPMILNNHQNDQLLGRQWFCVLYY